MENKSGKPTRFGFSWADEVEREEREQQQKEAEKQARRGEAKREQGKEDPFGAARPREVVLAEKGVDWRARDLELGLHAAPPPRHRCHRHGATSAEAAPNRADSSISASACRVWATPARGAPRGRNAAGGGPGPTPHPRRHGDSTPQPTTGSWNATPASHSAWGGGKGKCAGEGPAPTRRVRPVGNQGTRRVFSELNIGDGWSSAKESCKPGGSETEGPKATGVVVADVAPSTATMIATKFDESAVGQKRRGAGKKRKGRGLDKTKKQQQALLL